MSQIIRRCIFEEDKDISLDYNIGLVIVLIHQLIYGCWSVFVVSLASACHINDFQARMIEVADNSVTL